MANINNNKEPSTAPQPEKWYNLRLGSSFTDNSSTKFCTLRYEFKPASIDKNQAGSLHKSKENRVTVEFNNNQPGKPKVTFDGSCEDYKENDAVLFFDGDTFRLERLHRAMKRLRHVRLPGESMAAASVASGVPSVAPAIESRSPPLGKATKPQQFSKPIAVPVEVERIDIGEPESPVAKPTSRSTDYLSPARLNQSTASPDPKNQELDENLDVDVEDDEQIPNNTTGVRQELDTGFVMNQNDTDDEIADVDVSDDDAEKGPNAAEALRAQVNAAGGDAQSSSSSDSSGSASGSGSATSSSSNDGSDDDSASSGGDIDIE